MSAAPRPRGGQAPGLCAALVLCLLLALALLGPALVLRAQAAGQAAAGSAAGGAGRRRCAPAAFPIQGSSIYG